MRLSALPRTVTAGVILTIGIAIGAIVGAPLMTFAQMGPPPGPGMGGPGGMGGQGVQQPGMGQGMMRQRMMERRAHRMHKRAQMMKIMFAVADMDNDGALSFEEVMAVHRRIFNVVDANRDGRVTLEEVQNFMGQ